MSIFHSKKKGYPRGFTLIELLVVIAVVGTLTAATIISISGALDKARLGNAKGFAGSLQRALGFNVVGKWNLDEGFGTVATDTSGSSKNGTITGSPTWLPENGCNLGFKSCIKFAGTSGYIQVPNFDFGVLTQAGANGQWTLSAWARETNTNNAENIVVGRLGCHGGIYTWNGGYAFAIKTTACWTNAVTLAYKPSNMNAWHHLAAVYNNRTMRFYVDGTLRGTGTFTDAIFGYSTNLYIGGAGTYTFEGDIDEVEAYTEALTGTRIHQLYIARRTQFLARQ